MPGTTRKVQAPARKAVAEDGVSGMPVAMPRHVRMTALSLAIETYRHMIPTDAASLKELNWARVVDCIVESAGKFETFMGRK